MASHGIELTDRMVSLILKLIVAAYLCQHQASSLEANTSGNVTASTSTTTTVLPLDLTGQATDDSASAQLDPHESRPHPQSYGYSSQEYPYGLRRVPPSYQTNKHEGQAIEYVRETLPRGKFYKDSEENNYRHSQTPQQNNRVHEGYINSHEPPHSEQEPHSIHREYSYEEDSGNRDNYGNQDYSKEESDESKEDHQHDSKQPYLQYAYEVSRKKHEITYDPLDVPDKDSQSRYGPGETKVHPPMTYQHPAYYPRPKPTRYQPENYQDSHSYERHREGNYFQTLPKEAGYIPDEQKEPGYFQTPLKTAAYFQEAGYSDSHQLPETGFRNSGAHPQMAGYSQRQPEPRHHRVESGYSPKGHSDAVQVSQREAADQQEGGKVSIHIKHFGHASSDKSHHNAKDRQGFLLLPIFPNRDEKVKAIGAKYLQTDYKPGHQGGRGDSYQQRPVERKEPYIHQELPNIKYAVNPKLAISHNYGIPRSQFKNLPQPKYGLFQPVARHPTYEDSKYNIPRIPHLQEYSGDVPQERHSPVAPQNVLPYTKRKELKSLQRSHSVYGGSHGLPHAFARPVKYEPASLYNRPPRYESPYDVTPAYRSSTAKARGYQSSLYSSLQRNADYPKTVDYPSHTSRPKKKNSDTSRLYSAQYRKVGNRLASEYERSRLDSNSQRPKSLFLSQQNAEKNNVFRPSYTARGRTYGDLGLHHYESVLSKPKNGYYGLAPYSEKHGIPRITGSPNLKIGLPKIEMYA